MARRARGGMRDALSLADQVLARATRPTLEDLSVLDDGEPARDQVLGACARGDKAGVLGLLPADEGREGEVLADLLDHLRAAVLAGLCGPNAPQLASHAATPRSGGPRGWRADRPGERSVADGPPGGARATPPAPAHGRVLEAALLEMARDESAIGIADLVQRLETLEERFGERQRPCLREALRAAAPAAWAAPGPLRGGEGSHAPRRGGGRSCPPPAASSTPAPTPTRPEPRAEVSQGTATAEPLLLTRAGSGAFSCPTAATATDPGPGRVRTNGVKTRGAASSPR